MSLKEFTDDLNVDNRNVGMQASCSTSTIKSKDAITIIDSSE